MKEISFKLGIGYDEEFLGMENINELVQIAGDTLSEEIKKLPGVKWAGGDADEDPVIYQLIVVGDISRNDIEAFLELKSNSNGSEGDLIDYDFDEEVEYVNSGRPMDKMFAKGGKIVESIPLKVLNKLSMQIEGVGKWHDLNKSDSNNATAILILAKKMNIDSEEKLNKLLSEYKKSNSELQFYSWAENLSGKKIGKIEKKVTEYANDVVEQFLPILARVPSSDRKKAEGYLELPKKWESPFVDVFWNLMIPDKGEKFYEKVQNKVNEILLEKKLIGKEFDGEKEGGKLTMDNAVGSIIRKKSSVTADTDLHLEVIKIHNDEVLVGIKGSGKSLFSIHKNQFHKWEIVKAEKKNIPIESKRYPGQFTLGEDDGEKPMYTKEELDLIEQGYSIELELNASRRGKAEMEAYQKELKFETKLTHSEHEFGGSWRIWKQGEKLMVGGKLERIPASELEAIYLQSEKSGQELDWVLKQYGYTMADFDNSIDKNKMPFANGGPLVVEDENDTEYKLEYISNLIRQGNTSGYTPYWKLNIKFDGELEDSDVQQIAEYVEQGYHEGQIVSGEKTGWWSIDVEDTFAGGGGIKNQYKGKDESEVWNAWTEDQRRHFLKDHSDEIFLNPKTDTPIGELCKKSFNELVADKMATAVRIELINHIGTGQYSGGGIVGKRIKMIKMSPDPHPIEPGTMGTIKMVDGIGQIHVNWDNGRSLAVIPGVDEYEIEGEKMAEGGQVTLWKIGNGEYVKLKTGSDRAIKGFLTKNKSKYSGFGLQSWPSDTTEEQVAKYNATSQSSATSQEYSTGGAINFIKNVGAGYSVHSRVFGGWNLKQNGMHVGKYSDEQIVDFAENIGFKHYATGGSIGDNVNIVDNKSLMNGKSGVILSDEGGFWMVETIDGTGLVRKGKVNVIDTLSSGKGKKDIIVTKMSDIPNIQKRIDDGDVTYRGLGMGKLADDFYKLTGDSGKRIKIDKKEYFVTDSDYRSFEWDFEKSRWKNKIKFAAPFRKQ